MVALVADGILYLKVDAATAPEFEAAGLDPFAYTAKTGRRTVTSYRKAPGDVLENPDALAPWIGLAHGAPIGHITLSVGAVCRDGGDLAPALVARAERCLAAAQSAGGNRLVCETDPVVAVRHSA